MKTSSSWRHRQPFPVVMKTRQQTFYQRSVKCSWPLPVLLRYRCRRRHRFSLARAQKFTMLVRFFICMSIMWIYVISRVQPAGRLPFQKLNVGQYTQTVQPIFFNTWHACRYHCLLPFHTTFTDLDRFGGSQGQRKAKPIGFIFSHAFLFIRVKFDVMMKQFKLNIWDYFFFTKICWNKRNDCCLTDCVEPPHPPKKTPNNPSPPKKKKTKKKQQQQQQQQHNPKTPIPWACIRTLTNQSYLNFNFTLSIQYNLTPSEYTDTWPTSPNTDPTTPSAWHGSH